MATDGTTFGPPRGMRDFYPEDMLVRNAIFDAWRKAAGLFAFQPYDACVVENLDLLKRKAGEEIVDQIYNFTDKSGRELALRPEMTPTLARMVAARHSALSFPLKWYAIAQCFRYERMTKGRRREHFQWNLDVIGEPTANAEAEIVATAVHALSLLGLGGEDVRVHVNSRALLNDLLARLGCPADQHQAMFLGLDKRGKMPDADIATMLREKGVDSALVDRVFALLSATQSLEDVARLLGEETPSLQALRTFFGALQAYGVEDRVTFDLSVVRGLAYYTGIVFEAFDTNREFRAIFGGGRYDNLLGDIGGRPTCAVGLGFGDVVIAEILAARQMTTAPASEGGAAIGYMENAQRAVAMAAARAMRCRGEPVDLALHAEKAKAFFARAAKTGFQQAIYIGPDDVQGGTLRVKDMRDRSEQTVRIADLT